MDPKIAGAFVDDSPSSVYSTTRIFGVRLRKFSNWHRLLLNTAESPFLSRGNLTMRDLRIAVGICRLMPFVSRVRKPWIIPFFIYTSAILAAFVPSRLRSRKVRESRETGIQRALRKRIEAFLTYCGNYLQEPTFSIIPPELPGGKKPIPKTPRGRFHDAIEMTGELISWGIDEYRAWSMPIGQARVCRILYRKSIGMDVDIDEPEEEQFRNEMKAFLEAQKNQQKK